MGSYSLQDLFPIQRKLDQSFLNNIGIDGSGLLLKRVLAVLTEVGELISEVPFVFKFWSKKCIPKTEKTAQYYANQYGKTVMMESDNPALEEFVDILHFILTVGMDLKVDETLIYETVQTEDLDIQFGKLFLEVSKLVEREYQNTQQFTIIVKLFLGLGEMLGYSFHDVKMAYFRKNQINYERIAKDY